MKRIAIDMDEVMVDVLGKLIPTFNERYKTQLTKDDLSGKNLFKLYPDLYDEIYGLYNEPDFFRDMTIIENCKETIFELHKHYEIVIATAAMEVPNSFEAKYEWLKENFDFLDDQFFVFCGKKSVIHADYLIDDNLYQLNDFNNEGILFTAPHNVGVEYDLRVENWLEVREYFTSELVKS